MADTTAEGVAEQRWPGIATLRVITALVQAVVLYLLIDAATAPRVWLVTHPAAFVPMLVVAVYVPLIVMVGLGQLRLRALAAWASAAAAVVAGLGYHDATRGAFQPAGPGGEVALPLFQFWFAVLAGLFVAHVLVIDSVAERRLVPSYRRQFDTAWKLGVQAVLALVFVGVFWAVLFLGAGLFQLVAIGFFQRLIQHRWFSLPATTLALALSIHATDVQPALIRGAQTLALTLFSWLLPVLALIILGFLASLPFISLAPLWQTHFATSLLLTATGLVVLFINCFYQDGTAAPAVSMLRIAGTLGAIELLPLTGLAIWALALRVNEYGWTVERILASAAVSLSVCYAVGYASAVVAAPRWLKRLEITNFVTAYVFLALVLALFSPLADPARLMVAGQLARLRTGVVTPDKFDFAALKRDGGRWGAAALARLSETSTGPDATVIADRAKQAMALTRRYDNTSPPLTDIEAADRVTVYPAGTLLPAEFYQALAATRGDPSEVYFCLRTGAAKCLARMVPLRADAPAIVLLDSFASAVFEADEHGHWRRTARLEGATNCPAVRDAITGGAFTPRPHDWPDLVVGTQRITAVAPVGKCPPAGDHP